MRASKLVVWLLAVVTVFGAALALPPSLRVGFFSDPGPYLVTESDQAVLTEDGSRIKVPRSNPQITLTAPVQYAVYQRTGATGPIPIEGSVSEAGVYIEARFREGTWQSLGIATNGTVSGSITGAAGQGAVEVRVSGRQSTVVSVPTVGVGDVIAVWGQSNGSGRGQNNQVFTNVAGMSASVYGNDYQWHLIEDPTDSNVDQVDSVSSDFDLFGMGSIWPLVASQLIADTGVPVAFVPCTKGATGFSGDSNWNPTTNVLDRATLFGSALYRTKLTGAVFAIWWQGEGGFDDTTGNSYITPFNSMVSAAVAEVPGLKFIPVKLQECVGISDQRLTNGWYAVGRIWAENTNCLVGPTLADAPVGAPDNIRTEDEGGGTPWYHLRTDAVLLEASRRFRTNLTAQLGTRFPIP